MNLTESFKKRLQELAGVENSPIVYLSVDEGSVFYDDIDLNLYQNSIINQAYDITKKAGLHIYSTKDLSDIAYNPETNEVAGALYITEMSEVFSFDVVVKDEYKRKGIGKKLVEIAFSHYKMQKEAYGDDFEMEVEVINPDMEKLLQGFGMKTVRKLQNDTVLMTL